MALLPLPPLPVPAFLVGGSHNPNVDRNNRGVDQSPQSNGNTNNVSGIGNTVTNNNTNNIDQSVTNNDNRTINNYTINFNEGDKTINAGGCDKAGKGKGKGKAKGKGGCNPAHRQAQGPGQASSPQGQMMQLMSMMLSMMQQMAQGGGGNFGGGFHGGMGHQMGNFRSPGFF